MSVVHGECVLMYPKPSDLVDPRRAPLGVGTDRPHAGMNRGQTPDSTLTPSVRRGVNGPTTPALTANGVRPTLTPIGTIACGRGSVRA